MLVKEVGHVGTAAEERHAEWSAGDDHNSTSNTISFYMPILRG